MGTGPTGDLITYVDDSAPPWGPQAETDKTMGFCV